MEVRSWMETIDLLTEAEDRFDRSKVWESKIILEMCGRSFPAPCTRVSTTGSAKMWRPKVQMFNSNVHGNGLSTLERSLRSKEALRKPW